MQASLAYCLVGTVVTQSHKYFMIHLAREDSGQLRVSFISSIMLNCKQRNKDEGESYYDLCPIAPTIFWERVLAFIV